MQLKKIFLSYDEKINFNKTNYQQIVSFFKAFFNERGNFHQGHDSEHTEIERENDFGVSSLLHLKRALRLVKDGMNIIV